MFCHFSVIFFQANLLESDAALTQNNSQSELSRQQAFQTDAQAALDIAQAIETDATRIVSSLQFYNTSAHSVSSLLVIVFHP